ncbi:MAG: transketolase C-terminal domain-containing protein [Elusimicrobiota bacterium]
MQTMRDVLIENIYHRMKKDKNIFFLSADFGATSLDRLRNDFKDRFINVGIAEQNLINISCGLAIEGFAVFAYAIAPFLVMRACEQIRNNVSLMHQFRKININLIGVGAGLGYDISGPSHHSLEDISIMRTFPNITVFSPSDCILCKKFVNYALIENKPKYLRLDGKPLSNIYSDMEKISFQKGHKEIFQGQKMCIVSTGYMTHTAMKVVQMLQKENIFIGLVDIFMLNGFEEKKFLDTLKKYEKILTLEEGFINKAGLDTLILSIIARSNSKQQVYSLGFSDFHVLMTGNREYLHKLNQLDSTNIFNYIKKILL